MPFSPMEYGLSYFSGNKEAIQIIQGSFLFNENVNPDLEHKAKKASEKFAENLHIVSNGPSLAFYRIQEHCRQSLPTLVDKKHEVQEITQKVQGACFDTEYAISAVQSMERSIGHFKGIQEHLKNAMFMKQQIQYEQSRREQERSNPSMYRTHGLMRTQTVDIPGSQSEHNMAHSVQLPFGHAHGSPRARSSSLDAKPARKSPAKPTS